MNVDRVCPLCQGTNKVRVFAPSNVDFSKFTKFAFAARKFPEHMHLRLLECVACDVLYSSPVWSKDFVAAAYEGAGFDSGPEAYFASRTYQRLIDRILPQLPDCHSALDIGTGDGVFLERLLERGFIYVRGVEPSSDSVTAAKSHIRKLIRAGPFVPENFEPQKFSLITCFHVMEHLWDPLALCLGARALLKPGGALVAVVHNRKALSARILGDISPIFDIEHLQLFSLKSGKLLFDLAGYRDVRASSIWNRYPMHYWIKLSPFSPRVKSALIAAVNPFGARGLAISLPAGNLIISGFQRPARSDSASETGARSLEGGSKYRVE